MANLQASRTYQVRGNPMAYRRINIFPSLTPQLMAQRIFRKVTEREVSIIKACLQGNRLHVDSLVRRITSQSGWEQNIAWRNGRPTNVEELTALVVGRVGDLTYLERTAEARRGEVYRPGRAQLMELRDRSSGERTFAYAIGNNVGSTSFRAGANKEDEFLTIEQLQEKYGGNAIQEDTDWLETLLVPALFQGATLTRGINDLPEFQERLGKAQTYVHLLSCDSKAAAKEAEVFGIQMAARFPEKVIILLATEANLEAARTAVQGKSNIKVVCAGDHKRGINLNGLSDEASAVLLTAVDEDKVVIGVSGEANNLTLNNFTLQGRKISHFRFFVARNDFTQKMTGLLWMEGEKLSQHPYPVVIYLPAEIPGAPAVDFVGIRKTRLSLQQFHQALQIYRGLTDPERTSLRDLMNQHGLTIVEALLINHLDRTWELFFTYLPTLQRGNLWANYEDFLTTNRLEAKEFSFFDYCTYLDREAKIAVAQRVINGQGGSFTRRFYRLDNPAEASTAISEITDLRQRLRNDDCRQVTIFSALYRAESRSLPTPRVVEARQLPPGAGISGEPSVFFAQRAVDDLIHSRGESAPFHSHTAGYFWTEELDGRLRQKAPADFERVAQLFGLIDAAVSADGNITLPIYGKAYYARLQSGEIVFGRWRLGKGSAAIEGQEFSWEAAQVNPEGDISTLPLAVFTPEYKPVRTSDDLSDPRQDRMAAYAEIAQYKLDQTQDRINVVVWNNRAYVFDEPVYLQPEGIIFSFTRERFFRLFDPRKVTLSVDHSQPDFPHEIKFSQEVLPDELKGNVDWLYGGLTLVLDKAEFPPELVGHITGEQVLDSEAFSGIIVNLQQMARENFTTEGWFNEYSRLTQETQLQQIAVRGPRCFVVKTQRYYMPVVVDGRATDYSQGANFGEVIYYGLAELYKNILQENGYDAQEAKRTFENELASLQILNFDGGSSVGMGVVDNGYHVAVSNRAQGPNNGYDSERPVPLLLFYA